MTQSIDRLVSDETEPGTEEEYRALVRSLRRKRGFGLFFVQASPAKAQDVLVDLQQDLPQKRVAQVMLTRSDERLFEQLENLWEQERVDIFWIEGLEQSLLGYEDVNRLAGWSEQDLMTYSWKDVPPILSHLNLGRERFESRFDCALVFVVPLFVVKYLLRRAGDFFDWKSGFFEFPDDRQALAEQVISDGNYNEYLKLGALERLEKILQIRDLLDASEIAIGRRAELLREIGRLFEAGKDYEQAEISYERAVQLKPDFGGAWVNRGATLRRLGRYEKAIASFLKAIEINPKNSHTYNNLGVTYFIQKDYSKAIDCYLKAIELNPQYANAYHSLGVTYFIQKDYSKAIECYLKAIELNPQVASAYNNLGNTYDAKENYNKAIDCYLKAIELNPRYANAYHNLGNTYKDQKDYEKAIDCYLKAIEINPQDVDFYNNLGNTYNAQKVYNRAIDCYLKAVEINPQNAYPYFNLGNTYKDQKDYEKVIECYLKAIELNPQYTDAYNNLGQIHYELSRYSDAIDNFEVARSLDSQELSYQICLSYLYLLQDDIENSEKIIDVIFNNESKSRIFLNHGLLMSRKGETRKAHESWTIGLQGLDLDSNRDRAIYYVFSLALGQVKEGLDNMKLLAKECHDKSVFTNALNELTIISRSPQPVEGINDLITILEMTIAQLP